MVIVTGPEGDNFCFINNNNPTSNSVIIKKETTVANMVPNVPAANIMLLVYFCVVS